jgi:signal transduction histidine kinase
VNNSTGETQTVYLRVRSKGPISLPISAWNATDFLQHDRNGALLDGLYFGALLALILFNLFIYLSVRDSSYLYYVAYLGFIGLFMAATSGLLTRYFLPDNPVLANRLPYIFLYSSMIVGVRFAARINNTTTYAPVMLIPLAILAIVLFAALILGNLVDMYALSVLTPYLAIIMIGLALYVTLLSVRAGYRPSYYVAIAFVAIVVGGLTSALGSAGILNQGFWVKHSLRLGVVFEALLLSFALAYRIRYMQQTLNETRERASLERAGFSRKLIEVRDTERREIATELHDGVGQSLLVIKNKLSRLLTHDYHETGNKPPPLKQTITALRQIVQLTIDDTRNLSHRLHPHVLDRLGLTEAIKAVIKETLDEHGTIIESRIEDINLPKNSTLELHLYRIVQEGVKNIVMHANPDRVEISLCQFPNTIELLIEDFPKDPTTPWVDSLNISQCFGLSSIQERVELLRGKTVFSHNDSGGLRIQIGVPFSL